MSGLSTPHLCILSLEVRTAHFTVRLFILKGNLAPGNGLTSPMTIKCCASLPNFRDIRKSFLKNHILQMS